MKIDRVTMRVISIFTSLLLIGCGGGGGSSANIITHDLFESYSSISPGDSVVISGGRSIEGAYTADLSTQKVTSLTTDNYVGTKAYVSYSSLGSTESLQITPESSNLQTVSWACGTDTCGVLAADSAYEGVISDNGEDYLIAGDPSDTLDYLEYGLWVTNAGTGAGTYGVATFGSETPLASMPSSGNASYRGTSAGFYTTADGTDYRTLSDITASVNFNTGFVSMSSTNTKGSRTLSSFSTLSNLDFVATGSISTNASTSNSFAAAGQATLIGSQVNPNVVGDFFGPNAEVLGGVWSYADGTTLEAYTGAFGAGQ